MKKRLIRRGSLRRLCRIRLGPAHIDWGDERNYPFSYSLSKKRNCPCDAEHRRINDLGEWIFRNVGDCSVQLWTKWIFIIPHKEIIKISFYLMTSDDTITLRRGGAMRENIKKGKQIRLLYSSLINENRNCTKVRCSAKPFSCRSSALPVKSR